MSLSRELLERFKASPESGGVNLDQVSIEEINIIMHIFVSLTVC